MAVILMQYVMILVSVVVVGFILFKLFTLTRGRRFVLSKDSFGNFAFQKVQKTDDSTIYTKKGPFPMSSRRLVRLPIVGVCEVFMVDFDTDVERINHSIMREFVRSQFITNLAKENIDVKSIVLIALVIAIGLFQLFMFTNMQDQMHLLKALTDSLNIK